MTPYELAQVAVKALDARRAKRNPHAENHRCDDAGGLFRHLFRYIQHPNQGLDGIGGGSDENAGEMPDHIEGHREGTWVLSDYGCVVVHIFSPEAREFYDLERLWSDAEEIDISGIVTQD